MFKQTYPLELFVDDVKFPGLLGELCADVTPYEDAL